MKDFDANARTDISYSNYILPLVDNVEYCIFNAPACVGYSQTVREGTACYLQHF